VNWKPFYLDATAPVPGISVPDRLRQKIASSRSPSDSEDLDAVVQKLLNRLVSLGVQEGMVINNKGRIGNTRSAHRAILFSKKQSQPNATDINIPDDVPYPKVENAFVAALFSAYFEGGADITSHKDLADVAESVGLDRAAMLAWLDNGLGGQEVDAEARSARTRGLTGVPNFTVQGQQLDGAQDVESFLDLFVRIKQSEEARAKVQTEGKATSIAV
jgi:predicted DsbA family dithiol-disulfide isomerase